VSELALLINAGRYAELESNARQLLKLHPNSGFVWQVLGVALRMQGQDALPALERATILLPDDAGAHTNLGNALAQRGRLDDAAASYRRALALSPEFAEAHNNLGNVWRGLGQLDDAVGSYRRALHIKPDYAEAHHNLGDALLRLGKLDDAVASYRRAVALSPDFVEAHNNLGNALLDLGRPDDAMASYRRALAVSPDFTEAHTNLGNVLRGLGRLDEAVACYRLALDTRPDFAEAHSNHAIALRLQGRTAEAEASCRRALEINPDLAAAFAVLAEMNADKGLFAQAEHLFRRAISIEPETAEAWVGISRLRKLTASDATWAAEAQRIAGRSLAPRKEVLLRYAIGKYFDDVEDFEQAFANYQRANNLTKLYRARYDRQQLAQAIDLIIHSYHREWVRQTRIDANPSARPVFIVGMIRSGTTLAEQILASHRAVFGAGELMFWNTAAASYHPAALSHALKQRTLSDLASEYLRLLKNLSADALRVVDKMPGNFLHLGLIHAALPHARIIHLRRNPIDTCLSIYFQHFETFHAYATDLEDLAHYYNEYLRLMKHWRSSLPASTIIDVPYEGLVGDQEAWSRKMLEFIGLPWDPRCIDFHRTDRTVITASKWQVRQKISRSSVNRWRNYQKFVGPLQGLAEQ
jgi:tetratricopeptide (TPR) repeat protein